MTTLFSIITPVLDPSAQEFEKCIASVQNQTHTNWQWCVADNGSLNPVITERLRNLAASDSRVNLKSLPTNLGISGGSNAALEQATGEFVVLLDHDDELTSDALATIADVIASVGSDVDYLYSDEEIVDTHGVRVVHFAKPAWSPSRFRAQMYCGHVSVLRTEIVRLVGGFRSEFDGSQDYDIVLRVVERARKIIHIPRVLYRWCSGEDSVALDPTGKPWAYAAGIKAVQAHCDRMGIEADVVETPTVGVHRLERRLRSQPLVSIIIPTACSEGLVWGKRDFLVHRCLRSIAKNSTYKNIEIVLIIDDLCQTADALAELCNSLDFKSVQVVHDLKPFNFSRKVNLGAFHAHGDRLLFLNDDTEVIAPGWIEAMLGLLEEGDVGAVGAALLHPDETYQHAGQYLNDKPHHVLYRHPFSDPGPMSCLLTERECGGVTAACVMTRRDVFEAVGGFCEDLPNNYNDVDFSLKVRSHDLRVVWTPEARLWHHESSTRLKYASKFDSARSNHVLKFEHEFMRRRWQREMASDPYLTDALCNAHDIPPTFPLFR